MLTEAALSFTCVKQPNPSEPAQEAPWGAKLAVSEATNKVISFEGHSLPLCQKRKEDELPHKLLATFAPPEVTSSLFIFSF